MPKSRELTEDERATIVALHNQNVSLTNLARRYKISRSIVARVCACYRLSGSVSNAAALAEIEPHLNSKTAGLEFYSANNQWHILEI